MTSFSILACFFQSFFSYAFKLIVYVHTQLSLAYNKLPQHIFKLFLKLLLMFIIQSINHSHIIGHSDCFSSFCIISLCLKKLISLCIISLE